MEPQTEYYRTVHRVFSYGETTFTKREIRPAERKINIYGKIIGPIPWSEERLKNEAKALKLLAAKTTIPVPKSISLEYVDEAWVLTTELIDGVLLDGLSPEQKPQAVAKADAFIREVVLPQLRRLRSRTMGGLGGVVMPPQRVCDRDKRDTWPTRKLFYPGFNLCHNDLAQHNIFVDAETLEVKSIIDWESCGYYPAEFEAPLWLKSCRDYEDDDEGTDRLIHALLSKCRRKAIGVGNELILMDWQAVAMSRCQSLAVSSSSAVSVGQLGSHGNLKSTDKKQHELQ